MGLTGAPVPDNVGRGVGVLVRERGEAIQPRSYPSSRKEALLVCSKGEPDSLRGAEDSCTILGDQSTPGN